MVYIPSDREYSEFLAVPQFVRFSMPTGAEGPIPTLLIKALSLNLKYLIRLKRFSFIIIKATNGWWAYGVRMADDRHHPAVLWSLLEYPEEVQAIEALANRPRCIIQLFNELAVNVARGEADLDLRGNHQLEAILSAALHPKGETGAVKTVQKRLDHLLAGDTASAHGFILEVPPLPEWQEIKSTYITRSAKPSFVSIFSANEGDQQEQLAIWLTDGLNLKGCIKNPQVHTPTKSRELSDVLLSHEFGAFLIESKTLSMLERLDIPSREKLSRDVVKHIGKASRQLIGSLRYLKLGYRVTDLAGGDVDVERVRPAHAIIIVPDLSLLSDATDLGGNFMREFYQASGGVLHILDPVELLRIVQVAQMISKRSQRITPIMAFDYYLIERMKRTAELDTPAFGMIFRFAEEAELSTGSE